MSISRAKGLTGHLVRMKERRGACRILVGKLVEKKHFEDLDIGWQITLKYTLKKSVGMAWSGL